METACPCENRTRCRRWDTDTVTVFNDTERCSRNTTTTSCDSCREDSCGGETVEDQRSKVMNCTSCSCAASCDTVTAGCLRDSAVSTFNGSRVCTEVAGRGQGYVMTVALMRRMTLITSYNDPETVDLAANRFADFFRDSWKFGRCEEAIVVVISMDEQQIYTSTEEAAGRRLSDLDLLHLYRDYVTDNFWTGNITQRLPVLIKQFITLMNTPDPPRRPFDVWLDRWGNWFLLSLICATILFCIVYKQRLMMYKRFPACCQKRWLNYKNKGRRCSALTEAAPDEVMLYGDTISSMRLELEEEELQIRRNRQGFTW
ncbi:uncharacterized protein [Branchiostoma lanceolatum]|uniref:uncharacterized protein n=1 Tax=Branchiostoma lanceolatum TaxID=7740 RepID=UPI003455F60A